MHKNIKIWLVILFFLSAPIIAEQDELAKLREEALQEASYENKTDHEKLEEISFKSGGLSLQALNPEISVTGDFIGTYFSGDAYEHDYFDWNFRGVGLHIESYLDPFSKFKAAVPINSSGAELGEAYYTRYGIINNLNLTLGKFRQQFGIINRWHKHALDFFDFPLPIRMIFGPGGLNQTGISLDYLNSLKNTSHEITLQITDGNNSMINSSNTRNKQNVLLHYKNYRDLTSSTYLELGLTGLIAWNDTWKVIKDNKEVMLDESLSTKVYGIDFTVMWEPLSRMRYRNIEFRTELYFCKKNILAYNDSGKDTLDANGWYVSLNSKLSRNFDIGVHVDFYNFDNKDYANIEGFPYSSYAVYGESATRKLTSLYLTWWQSPFVKFRIEYNHESGDDMKESDNKLMFQTVFAAGPHKHERY